ncbi:uncharacterized protein V2V93DRAFT_331855, partial [Kockiozyma suomiensis]|uniref:uncharacterized protein n=1 Tax=Kockiozyma suomiensis TaxID=1337062 RepID=UPI00334300FA
MRVCSFLLVNDMIYQHAVLFGSIQLANIIPIYLLGLSAFVGAIAVGDLVKTTLGP